MKNKSIINMHKITGLLRKKLPKFLFLVMALMLLLNIAFTPIASALTTGDIKSIYSETTFYDPDACIEGSTPSSNNGSVYALGDSILENARLFGDLKAELIKNGYDKANITIDAIVGRSINGKGQTTAGKPPSSALESVSSNIDKIANAGTIIIVLGTNGDSYDASIPKLLKPIRDKNPDGKIVWVNVGITSSNSGDQSNMVSANKAINKHKDEYKYTVVDWYGAVDKKPSLIGDDGLHPTEVGAKKLVSLIIEAVGKYDKAGGVSTSGTPGATSGASSDYVKIFEEVLGKDQLKKWLSDIEKNRVIYEKAAAKVGIPWQMLAVVHSNENGLSRTNPGNGQGVYQFYEETGYTPGKTLSDDEFLEVSIRAANFLKNKPHGKGLKVSGTSDNDIKWVFFEYNGAADAYTSQAHRLGFTQGYDGSPYVMNFADDKRNPKKNASWVQFKCDGDCIETANTSFLGAWLLYIIAGGAGGGGTDCGGEDTSNGAGVNGWERTGKNAMIYYDQCDPKWANKPYGTSGSICTSGCGLTSMTMVIATLTNNKSITPDKMAIKYGSFHDPGVGTNHGLWPQAARDYGFKYKALGTDFDAARDILKKGGLIIFGATCCHFTQGGHLMVIRAMTEDGKKFYIADPNNSKDEGPYTVDFLMGEGSLSQMWGFYK